MRIGVARGEAAVDRAAYSVVDEQPLAPELDERQRAEPLHRVAGRNSRQEGMSSGSVTQRTTELASSACRVIASGTASMYDRESSSITWCRPVSSMLRPVSDSAIDADMLKASG